MPPEAVSNKLMAAAAITASEIGTSIVSCRWETALTAARKKGRPAYATAGSAISAETQCIRSRVAGPMSSTAPAQTAMESSITFRRGEARDGDGAQQVALLPPRAGIERGRVVGDEAIAQPFHRIGEVRRIARRPPPGQ